MESDCPTSQQNDTHEKFGNNNIFLFYLYFHYVVLDQTFEVGQFTYLKDADLSTLKAMSLKKRCLFEYENVILLISFFLLFSVNQFIIILITSKTRI